MFQKIKSKYKKYKNKKYKKLTFKYLKFKNKNKKKHKMWLLTKRLLLNKN